MINISQSSLHFLNQSITTSHTHTVMFTFFVCTNALTVHDSLHHGYYAVLYPTLPYCIPPLLNSPFLPLSVAQLFVFFQCMCLRMNIKKHTYIHTTYLYIQKVSLVIFYCQYNASVNLFLRPHSDFYTWLLCVLGARARAASQAFSSFLY